MNTNQYQSVGLKKDGTLKKGFKYAKGGKVVKAKLNGVAKTKKKATTTAKKLCAKVIKREGVKQDGTLKKGFKYAKGGKVVKAAAKKVVAKKATAKK